MSDILYPDNKHRGDRVLQLCTQIGLIQGEAKDCVRNNDNATQHAEEELNSVLKQHNFKTMDDLFHELEKLLPPDEKEHYQQIMGHYEAFDGQTKKLFEINIAVGFVTGYMRITAVSIVTIIDTGALASGVDLFARGWIALLEGDEIGLSMMRAGFTTFRALARGVEVSETAERIAGLIRTASSVLLSVSVALGGILLIYAAIKGAEQRTALQKAIVQLCGRRFFAAQVKDQISATNGESAAAGAILMTYNSTKDVLSPEQLKVVMENMSTKLVGNLKSDLDKITNDQVWRELDSIDSSISAWNNEDPNLQSILDWIARQPPLDSNDAITEVALPLRAYAYEKRVLYNRLGLYQSAATTINPRAIMVGGGRLR